MTRLKLRRFKVQKPAPGILAKYGRRYHSKDLHFTPESLPPISAESLFGADHAGETLVIDLGCGRGEFIVEQAAERPDELFVGIDYHQKSIWDGINRALKAGVENVRFVQADLRRVLQKVPDETVHEAYMLFPPTASIRRKRSSDPLPIETLEQIHRIMMVDAPFHFVSDHEGYFRWKRRMIERFDGFDVAAFSKGFEGGQTRFQRLWERFEIESLRLECHKKERSTTEGIENTEKD
jgi:tRNA G46 methylase TrmB